MKTIIIFVMISLMPAMLCAYSFLGPKWPGLEPVVEYYINEEGTPDVADEFDHLQRSFDIWNEVEGAAIKCQYMGTTNSHAIAPNHQNIIQFAEGNNFKLGSNVIAACYYWYQGSVMQEFDIEMNGRDFEWSTTGEPGKMDVGHIATHEVGHALGLGHSDVAGSVMWSTATYGDTTHRHLTSDDSTGLSKLYPRTSQNNHAPIITSLPVTEATTGVRYQYQVIATDADGDTLRYRLTAMPLNMKIDSLTGLVSWYPKFLDIGTHTVTMEVKDKFNAVARQTYKINVTDLVVYTKDAHLEFGDTLYQEILVTPMDGYGIIAGNVELTCPTKKMAILGLDTVGTILKGASYAKNITCDGLIRFAFAASAPFSGEGVLFRVKILVYKEYCGENLTLPITKAIFNDGDPVAQIKNSLIFMECGSCGGGGSYSYNIDGKVVYEANRMGVGGVKMALIEKSVIETTSEDGFFEFVQVPRTNLPYNITAEKDSGDIRDAITAYDASLILRHVVGLNSLCTFTHQILCADVNMNKMLTAYDAALILRFIVKYDDATRIGKWIMIPTKTTLPNLLEPLHNLEFKAIMIGDVSGNWNEYDSRFPKTRSDEMVASVSITEYDSGSATRKNDTTKLAVTTLSLLSSLQVYSGQFELTFDTARYVLYDVRPNAIINGYSSAYNVVTNKIYIAFAGTEALVSNDNQELFEVRLAIKDTSDIELGGKPILSRAMINENDPRQIKVEYFKSGQEKSPKTDGVTAIYPNPFNPTVHLDFSLTSHAMVDLSVYNTSGQKVSAIIAKKVLESGVYSVSWNGCDRQGKKLGSGIYIARFRAGEETVKSYKLYMIK
ncbi:MAG: hypothetical protein A2293_10225 [Elusimicrobia bacterium RIFOXYB2_FULL_49_7]|nr:MAG: hypothetical protein A2293_10225 [Elusimicrobia bacterium RIFOXYB2_FULL_49_7]